MSSIPFFTLSRQPQEIKDRIKQEVGKIIDSGEFSCGKNVASFETRYADYNGAKFCVLTQSGTDALFIAFQYYLSKVNKTKKVYLPAQSFFATASVPYFLGFDLQFVDVGEDCNISIDALNTINVGKNPLFLPVGLYGSPPDLKFLKDTYPDAFTIFDGCQAHGALLDGKFPINYCDILVTSFYATKNLGAITESGALLTNNPDIYEFALSFRNHGRLKFDYNSHLNIGLNFRPSEIMAAGLNVKLDYLDLWTQRRIEIGNFYTNTLSSMSGKIKLSKLTRSNKNVYHLYPVFVKNRDKVRELMAKNGIGTNCQYPKILPHHQVFEGKFTGNWPLAEEKAQQVLTLPLFPELNEQELIDVMENLNEIVERL